MSRSANRYLKRIRYGNTSSRLVQPELSQTAWRFEVVLDYGERHYQATWTLADGSEVMAAIFLGTIRFPELAGTLVLWWVLR